MKIDFFSQGPIAQISGGYIYNQKILEFLSAQGAEISYHSDPAAITNHIPSGVMIIDSIVIANRVDAILALKVRPVLLLHVVPPELDTQDLSRLISGAHVIATGQRVLDEIRAQKISVSSDIMVVEPGVAADIRPRTEARKVARNLLCLANYIDGKGYAVLFEAMRGVGDLAWQLQCYGNHRLDPATFRQIQQLAQSEDFDERIRVNAAISPSAVSNAMAAADLLVVLSEHESYSMVTAEAIAAGIPVLSTRTGNWEHFSNSDLVEYLDDRKAANVSAALRRLLTDNSYYQTLQRSEHWVDRTWDDAGQEFAKAIGSLH